MIQYEWFSPYLEKSWLVGLGDRAIRLKVKYTGRCDHVQWMASHALVLLCIVPSQALRLCNVRM